MLAGEAIGGRSLADVRLESWRGPWGWGVRPGQDVRVRAPVRVMRPEANRGSRTG